MTTARLGGVDEAKGIAIFLVVVGHVWLGLNTAGVTEETPSFVWLVEWMYTFHMPVFFVIAGMLATRSLAKRGGQDFLVSKVGTIVYPYLVWSILQWVLQRVFNAGGGGATSGSLLSILVTPFGQFWFLYTLAATYGFHALTKCLKLPDWGFLVLALVAYIYTRVGFWPWEVLQGVACYSIFYALGVCLTTDALRPWRYHLWLGIGGLAIVALGVMLGWNMSLFGRLCLAIVGCGGLITLACWVSQKPWGMLFRELGKASLAIFVAHTIFAAGLRTVLLKLGFSQPDLHLLLGILAGIVGPLILLMIERRLALPYFFTWPANRASRSA